LVDQGARRLRGGRTLSDGLRATRPRAKDIGGSDMIDAHHHFWWTGRHAYSWPEQVGDRFARDFTPDDLRPELARAGVKGTVLIQVLHQVGGETEECLDLSKEVDFVRGVVGWLPLADPDATSRAIERLSARGGKLVGVRHLISNEPDPRWLLQDGVLESLKLLAAAKLAFDAIPVNTAQFESVLEVAGRLPELKMVINHLGRPPLPEQGWEPWATQVARAAEHRNVSMKLSIGLDIIMRWRWSTDAVRRYSDHVLDLFSPDRVMAASNWPVILLGASYAETWSGITELVAELSADERRAVLGGTAKRIYGL
jgi:L-fuconolactonase